MRMTGRHKNRMRLWPISLLSIAMLLTFSVNATEPGTEPMDKASNVPAPLDRNQPAADPAVVLDGPQLNNSPTWSETLRAVLLTAIPDQYEDRSHWEKTTKVFDGLDVRQKGFDVRVKERRRVVNHGPWQRYKIQILNPAKNLTIRIDQIRSTGLGQFRFRVFLASKLRCRADFENWFVGVKGFNMTVITDADVQIVAECQLAIRTESKRDRLIPDFVLDPHVNAISLALSNLDVQRIGEIRGDLAEGIGDSSRRFIENIMKAQERRVLKKANEAIDKKRSSLRTSAWHF